MKFLNALEQAKWHIATLYIVTALLVLICLSLILGWHSSQSKIKVLIPPQIPTSGLVVRNGEVPKASIYSFAFYIWQSINYWPQNGILDYKNNIKSFASYLTPEFKAQLEADYNKRLADGELQDRLRTMIGLNGAAFDPENVINVGHGTWLVHVTMRLTERMDTNGKPIKDAAIDYSLRVVQYNVNSNKNKWGLALDGFAADAKRIKTYE